MKCLCHAFHLRKSSHFINSSELIEECLATGKKSKTRNHASASCCLLNLTKATILWFKIILFFSAYFLALLETWAMLFFYTVSHCARCYVSRLVQTKKLDLCTFLFIDFLLLPGRRYTSLNALICYCFASILLLVHIRGYNEFIYVNITIQVQERMRGN